MIARLKIIALALGLAVAGGSIAQAATPVADQTISTHKTIVTTKPVHHVSLRKHRLHIAHLRHLRRLHEARMMLRHHAVKTVKIDKTVKVHKTVVARHVANKPVVVR